MQIESLNQKRELFDKRRSAFFAFVFDPIIAQSSKTVAQFSIEVVL